MSVHGVWGVCGGCSEENRRLINIFGESPVQLLLLLASSSLPPQKLSRIAHVADADAAAADVSDYFVVAAAAASTAAADHRAVAAAAAAASAPAVILPRANTHHGHDG